jgi:hypothetical protein
MTRPIVILTFLIATTFLALLFTMNEIRAEEYYRGVTLPECTFSHIDQIENRTVTLCYSPIDGVLGTPEGNLPVSGEEDVIFDSINPSINMEELNTSRIWKSKVSSHSIPQERYHNIAEPSLATNGTLVFYAGNHFAAKSVDDYGWDYIDPYFDFKGVQVINVTNSNFSRQITDIFKADQHVEYDPVRRMYLWIRQSEQVISGGGLANIDRLGISRDLDHWLIYDLISTDVLNEAGIIRAVFDYPDTVLTNRYLYLTTTVYANEQAKYGLIFRFSLDNLSNALDQCTPPNINYEIMLDRDVEAVTPVDGASNPMYFGSHPSNNSNIMKISSWSDDSQTLNSTEIAIKPWNAIKNRTVCSSNPEAWWCKATTSSRIRSAWMLDNSISFLWNAVVSYDKGMSWLPYTDSATFHANESMRYERKYHLADPDTSWVFGAASPNRQGGLGVGALYVDNRIPNSLSNPYVNFAFGVFDDIENKWKMMPIQNSSARLPVRNEGGINDYTVGDFLTTKEHMGNDLYSWDVGGYIIVGPNYYDIEPYYIMIKN